NFEEAIVFFKKAKETQPGAPAVSYYLGVALKKAGDIKGAMDNLIEALNMVPPVAEAYTELIEIYYSQDKLTEAKEWIAKAEAASVKPGAVAFFKGLVLLKEDDNTGAIEAFNKAKELDLSLAQSVNYQLAAAYSKERQFANAKTALEAVIEADPASDMASFAKEYQKAVEDNIANNRQWRFTLGIAYRFDDNVLLKPEDGIPGIDISGQRDSAIINTFRIDYQPNLGSKWFLNAQYNLISNLYFRNDTHNLLIQSLTLNPGYNLKDAAISLPITYNYALLKGSAYMGLLSLRPTANWMFEKSHIAQGFIGYERRDMLGALLDPDENRTGNRYLGGLGYVYILSEGKGMLNFRYEYSQDITEGQNWANVGNKLSAGATMPLAADIYGILNFESFFQNYKYDHTVFGFKRIDDTYTGTVGVVWQAANFMDVNLQYMHTTAYSNIFLYKYNRNMVTTGVEFRF
ncbi:MAG: surface lipoprotein assembly modifier, partial [Candidatus Magnetominusculus sp. LBB02]|nr:surface lipoprotein assembly modifier [Candidatus Magnetominusculus sp. LBB02]